MTKLGDFVQKSIKELLESAPQHIKNSFLAREYAAGQPILLLGEENKLLYVIIEGSAEVCYATRDGSFSRVNYNEAYSVFGEVEIFHRPNTTNGVFALSRCKIITIPKESLLEWMKIDVRVSQYLLYQLSEKMLSNTFRLRRLGSLSVNQRVLDCIYFRHRVGTLGSYTKDELCAEASAPLRSINRSVSYWKTEGIIDYKRRFFITNVPAVERICAEFEVD